MTKRRRRQLLAWCAVLLLVGLGAGRAEAQAPPADGLDVNTFNVAVGNNVYVTQHGASVPDHLAFGVGLMFNYGRNPFAIYEMDSSGEVGERRSAVVENMAMAELFGYIGLFKWVSIGLSMPIGATTGSEVDATGATTPGGSLSAFSWGDLGLHVKARLYGKPEGGIALGALLSITAPIGRYAENFAGEESATFRPRFIAEYRSRVINVAVNLGAIFRPKVVSFFDDNFRVGQQMTYGVGLSLKPAAKIPLRILVELFGRTDFRGNADGSPMEAGGAIAYELPRGVHLLAGATGGLVAGLGTPDFRVYLGVRWAPNYADSDGDGIPDVDDKCPKIKEDADGFEDHDGCPEADNDGDGIPDERDKCPNQAEDNDKFEDADGCPDPDNDADGIPDKKDNCPINKGPAKYKGCPPSMLDVDGDGVPDNKDKCPDKMEDKDGFQDADGCPDPDNDADGIPDEHDKCPNLPEDKDGNADADGCPDADDDGDGICDDNPTIQKLLPKLRHLCTGADKCPKKKETINGNADTDGCPDRGRSGIVVSAKKGPGYEGRLLFRGNALRFKGDSKELAAGGAKLLDQLVLMLRANQAVKKITVMAFTDLKTPRAKAKKVTLAWAAVVQDYLLKQGIPSKRVTGTGAGNMLPVCNNRSRRCNRRNRRIEIFITELGN